MSLTIYHAEGELLYHRAMAEGLPRDGVPTVAVKGYRSHRALGRMWAACRRAHKPRRGPRSTRLTRHRAALVCIREHRIQRRKAWRVMIPEWPPGSGNRRRKFEREWAKWEAEMAPINAACDLPTIAEQIEALRKIGTPRAARQIEWLQLWEDGDKAAPPNAAMAEGNSLAVAVSDLLAAKMDTMLANMEPATKGETQ